MNLYQNERTFYNYEHTAATLHMFLSVDTVHTAEVPLVYFLRIHAIGLNTNTMVTCGNHTECKGKAVPLQAWSGPEGSRKLRFPDFMTTAQDGGKVVSLTHRPPLPQEITPGTRLS